MSTSEDQGRCDNCYPIHLVQGPGYTATTIPVYVHKRDQVAVFSSSADPRGCGYHGGIHLMWPSNHAGRFTLVLIPVGEVAEISLPFVKNDLSQFVLSATFPTMTWQAPFWVTDNKGWRHDPMVIVTPNNTGGNWIPSDRRD